MISMPDVTVHVIQAILTSQTAYSTNIPVLFLYPYKPASFRCPLQSASNREDTEAFKISWPRYFLRQQKTSICTILKYLFHETDTVQLPQWTKNRLQKQSNTSEQPFHQFVSAVTSQYWHTAHATLALSSFLSFHSQKHLWSHDRNLDLSISCLSSRFSFFHTISPSCSGLSKVASNSQFEILFMSNLLRMHISMNPYSFFGKLKESRTVRLVEVDHKCEAVPEWNKQDKETERNEEPKR